MKTYEENFMKWLYLMNVIDFCVGASSRDRPEGPRLFLTSDNLKV